MQTLYIQPTIWAVLVSLGVVTHMSVFCGYAVLVRLVALHHLQLFFWKNKHFWLRISFLEKIYLAVFSNSFLTVKFLWTFQIHIQGTLWNWYVSISPKWLKGFNELCPWRLAENFAWCTCTVAGTANLSGLDLWLKLWILSENLDPLVLSSSAAPVPRRLQLLNLTFLTSASITSL